MEEEGRIGIIRSKNEKRVIIKINIYICTYIYINDILLLLVGTVRYTIRRKLVIRYIYVLSLRIYNQR